MKYPTLTLAALVAVITAIAAIVLYIGLDGITASHEELDDSIIVIAETDGLASIVSQIACPDSVRIIVLASGGDPHFQELTPSLAAAVRRAALVVVVPDSPAGAAAARIAEDSGALLVKVSELDLEWIYIDGVKVYHGPWYHPGNASLIAETVASALYSLDPDCREEVNFRLREFKNKMENLEDEYSGILYEYIMIGDLPYLYYLAEWLDPDDIVILKPVHEGEVSPGSLEEALEALYSGRAIVFVSTDGDYNVLSRAGEWLAAKAQEAGVPMVQVPAPWIPGDLADRLERVAESAARASRG